MINKEFDYYTPPPQTVFEDIKINSIRIWEDLERKSPTYGEAEEAINKIKNIQNVRDNAWFIVAMFDSGNQMELVVRVNEETREYLKHILFK